MIQVNKVGSHLSASNMSRVQPFNFFGVFIVSVVTEFLFDQSKMSSLDFFPEASGPNCQSNQVLDLRNSFGS